eukprot:525950_1
MASAEDTPISKELLRNLHRRRLINGQTNSVHQEAIIDALGGIDNILQHLLTSNAILDEQQLDSLHHIIANTSHNKQQTTTINAVSQPQEDKAHITIPAFTYTFKDEDSFLFTIFGQENGTKILHILNGTIFKCILLLLFGLGVPVTVLMFLSVLAVDVWFVFCTVFFIFCSIYIIGWILYANKEAMKLLLRQFVFWFKIFYLIQYLVTHQILHHFEDFSPFYIFADGICLAVLLFIVMIFDAINTTQSTKLIISCFAVAWFAGGVLGRMMDVFYADQSYASIYNRAILTFDMPYVDKARISIVDICVNSGEVVSVFLFKQLVSIIKKPNKA